MCSGRVSQRGDPGAFVGAVLRATKEDQLEYLDAKKSLIDRPGLEIRYASNTRRQVDHPQATAQAVRMIHLDHL